MMRCTSRKVSAGFPTALALVPDRAALDQVTVGAGTPDDRQSRLTGSPSIALASRGGVTSLGGTEKILLH